MLIKLYIQLSASRSAGALGAVQALVAEGPASLRSEVWCYLAYLCYDVHT